MAEDSPRRQRLRQGLGLLALSIGLLASCRSEAGDRVVLEPREGPSITVEVELATTHANRQRGLMYRSELGPRQGMLFIFPRVQPQNFWMRNTKIPLDILYLEEDGEIVNIHRNTKPFSEKGLPSEAPVRFVLEVPGGFCETHGIQAGDRVQLGSLAQRSSS